MIPEGVIEIKNYMLDFKNLNDVILPSSIRIMGANSFNNVWKEQHMTSSGLVVWNGILVDGASVSGEISIPEDIKCIADGAFYDNKNITNVTIPRGVKRIGEEAFFQCDNLEKVEMNEGLEVIGREAFSRCYKLRETLIPSTVKESGIAAFESTVTTNNTSNSSGSEELNISDGVLLSGKNTKGEVVIPEGVTKIADFTFYNNQNITSVKIPSTVKEIGKATFAGSKIKKVIIPGSVKNIPNEAFEQCKDLEEVTFEDGVETIGSFAFSGCAMTSIDLPSSVTKIGIGAFRGCSKLEIVKRNQNINVEEDAFSGTKVDNIEITSDADKNTKPKVQVGDRKSIV